jgi:prefoldin subunit 5
MAEISHLSEFLSTQIQNLEKNSLKVYKRFKNFLRKTKTEIIHCHPTLKMWKKINQEERTLYQDDSLIYIKMNVARNKKWIIKFIFFLV